MLWTQHFCGLLIQPKIVAQDVIAVSGQMDDRQWVGNQSVNCCRVSAYDDVIWAAWWRRVRIGDESRSGSIDWTGGWYFEVKAWARDLHACRTEIFEIRTPPGVYRPTDDNDVTVERNQSRRIQTTHDAFHTSPEITRRRDHPARRALTQPTRRRMYWQAIRSNRAARSDRRCLSVLSINQLLQNL